MTALAFIALGSNMGDSVTVIHAAIERLGKLSDSSVAKSSLWKSSPVDCPPGSSLFLNAAVAFVPRPGETPEGLLQKLQLLEKEFGRQPKRVLNEARPLDLDLIAFCDEVRATPTLTLPHPRAHQRRFVLQPLAEIAPAFTLPGQVQTVSELLTNLNSDERLERIVD